MSKSIAIYCQNLIKGQLSYFVCTQLNKFTSENVSGVNVFVDDIGNPCIYAEFPILHSFELYSFDGTVIATDYNTAGVLINCPSPTRKILYINDLEWMYPVAFKDNASIYGNKELEIITCNDRYKEIVENAWNRKVLGVVNDFDIEKIMEILK